MKECLKMELDVISIDCRLFEYGKCVGRSRKPLEDFEIVLVGESFLRKLISEHEKFFTNKINFL